MTVKETVSLYRARYRKWKAEPGTEEWYRAVAQIRDYNGDRLLAVVARTIANFQRAMKELVEGINRALENWDADLEGRVR